MAKAGMRRPSPYDPKNHGTEHRERPPEIPRNDLAPVPGLQGRVKTGNTKARNK